MAKGHSLSLLANKRPLWVHTICTYGVKQSQTPGEEHGFSHKQAFGPQVSTDDPEILPLVPHLPLPTSLILPGLLDSDTPTLQS